MAAAAVLKAETLARASAEATQGSSSPGGRRRPLSLSLSPVKRSPGTKTKIGKERKKISSGVRSGRGGGSGVGGDAAGSGGGGGPNQQPEKSVCAVM